MPGLAAPNAPDATPAAGVVSDCSAGYVALTFDDGPSETTPQLLAALARTGLRATMFDIGVKAAAHPELVRAEQDAGMWVENHTYTHPHLTRLTTRRMVREIVATQQLLHRLTGRAPTLLRPPFLNTDARVRRVSHRLGLLDVMVTVDSRDYAGASTDQIVHASARLRPGGIILLHDWPRATIPAVPRIAAVLAERHLCTGRIARDPATGGAVAVAP